MPAVEKAPDDIQRIVWAVLRNGTNNCILLHQEPKEKVTKLLRDGEKASAAVRALLRDYATDVFVAPVEADCKFQAPALYCMRPEVKESGVFKRMYVKFAVDIDNDDESLSTLQVIRFHASSGYQSITRFPRR
jgi:hypothetical protein